MSDRDWHVTWAELFGNADPVEVEIGPGTGTFLVWVAAANPRTNYFAIERAWRRFRHLEERLETQRLSNVRLIAGDAACIARHLIPPRSVAAYHIYFPDPWWKTRHHQRRLLTPQLAADLWRTLKDDGVVYFASDVPIVDRLARASLSTDGLFRVDPELRSPRSVQTSFERKGLARGARIHDAVFVKQLRRDCAASAPSDAAQDRSDRRDT